MKITSSLVLIAALGACEQPPSRLDKISNAPAAPAASAPSSPHGGGGGSGKIDRNGSVEQQLARLQDAYDRNAEAMDFLNKVYGQQKAQQAQQEREEPAEDAMFAVDVSGEIAAGQVDGPADAPVTIVKAFDFLCPYCQRVSGTMEELVKDYGGKVRVVYANMVVHAPARNAHLASCAAAKQGKYMAFKDAWWAKGFGPYVASQGKDQASISDDNIVKIAQEIGLDTAKLKTDMASPECAERVSRDQQEMSKFHVNATPTFFVNGKHIGGALPKEAFKKIIDEQLAQVEKSGVAPKDYYAQVVLAKGEKQFRSKVDPKP